MNERRKEQRHLADLPAQFKGTKKAGPGTVRDASMHGMFVACDEPPALRQLVQVEVTLPTGSKFTAHTMVVHHGTTTKGAGLEFFGKGDRPEWEEYVRQLARNPMPRPAGGLPAPPMPPMPPTAMSGGYPAVQVSQPPVAMSAPPMPMAPAPAMSAPPMPPPAPPGASARPAPPPPPQRSIPSPPTGLPGVPPATSSSPGLPQAPRISNLPSQPNALGLHQLTPAGGVQQPPGIAPGASMPPQASPPAQLPPHVLAAARGVLRIGAAYQGAERRVAPRVRMQLELRLRTSRNIHVAHTLDISMTGAGLLVGDCPLQVGEQIILNLIQPGTSMSFRRDGIVSRVTSVVGGWSHVAVQFAAIDSMREVLFANFMNTAYAALHPGG